MRIVVLDPDSSDPTWGGFDDALILDLSQEDWDRLDVGQIEVADLIAKIPQGHAERGREISITSGTAVKDRDGNTGTVRSKWVDSALGLCLCWSVKFDAEETRLDYHGDPCANYWTEESLLAVWTPIIN